MKSRILIALLMFALFYLGAASAQAEVDTTISTPHVAQMNMDMLILPGTLEFLKNGIQRAEQQGAKFIIIHLDTPGGLLESSQNMTQAIFDSKVPIAIYVSPSGSTATSAGVFITVSGHVAAMAPGTSIGAAHPVTGEGKDIEGDMRKKASNMASAMVKSIAQERGRNAKWVVKAVRKSSSLTETEALKENVVDFIAKNQLELLQKAAGKKIKLAGKEFVLEDYSKLPVVIYEPSFQARTLNFLANPNVAAILWLAATTGISIELYNPGLILPGVVGVICLILALAVSHVIPVSYVGISLIACGAILFALELFVTSGILAVGGIISIVLGMIYLFDPSVEPYLRVSLEFIIPLVLALGAFLLWSLFELARSRRMRPTTGKEGLIGEIANVRAEFQSVSRVNKTILQGKVFLNGEYWNAIADLDQVEIGKGVEVKVIAYEDGFLIVQKLK